ELAGAIERLRSCDTPDLAALCAQCLAASPEDRWTGAGGISSAIARHFATPEERLRGAEIPPAAGRTPPQPRRRRPRATLVLAAPVLATILPGVSAWAWVRAHDASRRSGVDARARASLEEAARLLGQAETSAEASLYARASAAADRAQAALAAGEGSPDLAASAGALLERIRAESSAAAGRAERDRPGRPLHLPPP